MSGPPAVPPGILLVDSSARLTDAHRGAVVVSGSHGGLYAGYCAARDGVRALIQNDAGFGLDDAGAASLPYLDGLGIPAAVADSRTTRIADGQDSWTNGIVSRVNAAAAALGCRAGDTVAGCAHLMLSAGPSTAVVSPMGEARFVVSENPGEPAVHGIDSASLFRPEDAGRIVITGSHGGLVGGRPDSTTPDVWAALYNDAGGCRDGTGFGRLPDFDRRGIAAATVRHMSARIGDARSHWDTGIVSRVNETARARGGDAGMTVREFVAALAAARHAA